MIDLEGVGITKMHDTHDNGFCFGVESGSFLKKIWNWTLCTDWSAAMYGIMGNGSQTRTEDECSLLGTCCCDMPTLRLLKQKISHCSIATTTLFHEIDCIINQSI